MLKTTNLGKPRPHVNLLQLGPFHAEVGLFRTDQPAGSEGRDWLFSRSSGNGPQIAVLSALSTANGPLPSTVLTKSAALFRGRRWRDTALSRREVLDFDPREPSG
jgi:hypothetical protein